MGSRHRLSQQLSAYLDQELAPDEQATVERELAHSEALRLELGELQQTKQLLAHLREPDLPRAFDAELRTRLDTPPPFRIFQWLPRPATALAAVLAVVVLAATPLIMGHRDRLRAAEVSPDVFIRAAAQSAASDPYMDQAYLGLITTDTNLRLAGEEPRGASK